MKKYWPLLAILAAAIAAILILNPFGKPASVSTDEETRGSAQASTAPSLANAPSRRAKPTEGEKPDTGSDTPSGAPAAADGPAITGTVVDDETGAPISGALVVVESSDAQCPRVPAVGVSAALFSVDPRDLLRIWAETVGTNMARAHPVIGHEGPGEALLSLPIQSLPAVTGADGAFRILLGPKDRGDLFARAPGHVLECVCGVTTSSPVTVRLKRGAAIRGNVMRADGRPIVGATIDAKPGPGTPNLPGHVERAESDKEGAFTVTGLLPGALVLTADHPKFVPTTLPPMEPGGAPIRIVLVPALVTTFQIHTDSGKQPENPSLAWTTSSSPPRSGLLLLPLQTLPKDLNDGSNSSLEAAGYGYGPVKIPCDAPDATFEVKAVGYSSWRSAPETLPPEGAERTIDVPLNRDLTLGSLKLTFEDRDGEALSYAFEKMEAQLWRRDNRPVPAGIVLQPADALTLPALPAGPYGIVVRSPGHAPGVVLAEVVAGRDGEQKVTLGLPAKLRVKFTAVEATLVHFRVLFGNEVAFPFPEGATTVAQSEGASGEPVFHAGPEGLLLTGLGAGRHVIEVVSPGLTAPATPVDLAEGETREVEIPVTKR